MTLETIEEAYHAVEESCLDIELDFGADAVEAGYYDIVRIVADRCTDEVAEELLRREGIASQEEVDRHRRELLG